MKKYILLFALLFTAESRAQWIVNDPLNYIANIGSYMEDIKRYTQMLQDAKEFLQQTKMLENAFEDGGLWDETFKSLKSIYNFLEEARDVISIVHARDVYALIPYLPIDDDWKANIYTIINDAHGLVNEDQFNYMVDLVAQRNPYVSDFLIRSRAQGRGGLDHRLNSYYFVSARQEPTDKRFDLITKQKNRIEMFTDRSQGESTNMINSQLVLIAQQNEEIIKAMHHQITSAQNDYIDKQMQEDMQRESLIKHELQRQNLDLLDFITY